MTICKQFFLIIFSADVPVSNASRKFLVDSSVDCRILNVDLTLKRLVLTAKKSLVDPTSTNSNLHELSTVDNTDNKDENDQDGADMMVVDCYDPRFIGLATRGTVVQIRDTGILVAFYGNAKSLDSQRIDGRLSGTGPGPGGSRKLLPLARGGGLRPRTWHRRSMSARWYASVLWMWTHLASGFTPSW